MTNKETTLTPFQRAIEHLHELSSTIPTILFKYLTDRNQISSMKLIRSSTIWQRYQGRPGLID